MNTPRIAVLGGGISGLAAAHRLHEIDPTIEIQLWEASSRLGGILQTVRRGEYLVERSADMFTTREPWALNLAQRVGLANELISTNTKYRQALVAFQGRLQAVPEGFTLLSPTKLWPLVTSPLFTWAGKLRIFRELFVPCRGSDFGDESLASFARRRLGNEAFERLIQPLVGGIYTADPEKLSLAATMPQFLRMERQHGGLLRAMFRTKQEQLASETGSGARYGMFVAPRNGMSSYVDAIAAKLPEKCVRLNTKVVRVERTEQGWSITPEQGYAEHFDALIYALPGYTSELLHSVDESLAKLVAKIPHAGCSVVVLGFKRDQISHPLDAFGFVVPAIEKRKIIAGSFASVKFEGRAPQDRVLIRVFLGGALQPKIANLPDAELIRIARDELEELIGAKGEPELCEVVRWLGVMPQYHVGHLELVDKIESTAARIPYFALAGNVYRGVGIPFCVHSGEVAAEWVVKELKAEFKAFRWKK